MIFEIILEAIVYFFVEIVFQGIILGIFRAIKLIGLFALKVITLSGKPIGELKENYNESSKPYFLGFGITIGIVWLIIKLIN